MAIMKKGNVHTKGSINELKLKHGEGLNIKIKLQPVKIDMNAVDTIDTTKIFEMVKQEVGDQIQVKDQHEVRLHIVFFNKLSTINIYFRVCCIISYQKLNAVLAI